MVYSTKKTQRGTMKIKSLGHLSPSTINLFIRDKAQFIMKLSGVEYKGSFAKVRGQAVEKAVLQSVFYKNRSLEDSIKIASDYFQEETLLSKIEKNEKYDKEKTTISDYVLNAIPTYQSIEDEPLEMQRKIELKLDEVQLPIIGYIDIEFENHIRDLKTTKVIKSSVPHSVQRQLSIYSKAVGKDAWVDYVSPKKIISSKIINVENNIQEVITICKGIEKLLSISDDIQEIASMFYPNLDSWEWDKESINQARRIWSIKK